MFGGRLNLYLYSMCRLCVFQFFKWADQVGKRSTSSGSSNSNGDQVSKLQLADGQSIATFCKASGVNIYCQSQLIRKTKDAYKPHLKNFPVSHLSCCLKMYRAY